jgi:hypothetical protein
MSSNRQNKNRQILAEISAQIEAYPDLRFHQILHNIGVTELDVKVQTGEFPHDFTQYSSDKFYEESDVTYKRIKETNG